MTGIAVGFAGSGVGAFTSRLARYANGLGLAADGAACGAEGVPRSALRTRRGGRAAPGIGNGHATGRSGASGTAGIFHGVLCIMDVGAAEMGPAKGPCALTGAGGTQPSGVLDSCRADVPALFEVRRKMLA